ncbi:Bug family tripartite tricarboxylate transporter substrate binding protein [Polaromonas sp. CT11-55]|uniref:Bug family tripartite tricarboxylate transporter substrate binding protein n=1 Tax=Polaromonas sp. CT11-55 TaxID=3243045 RepID=UPI0039A6982A
MLSARAASSPEAIACLVPAKAGGGFDLTCRLAGAMLEHGRAGKRSLEISYMPGGIGAVAFDRIASGKLANPDTLVAFSSGSLLNLAQGKFGPHTAADVRWVAAIATDYGVIAVHKDSPVRSLTVLAAALKKDLASVIFGAGGTVGSQDWIKAALLVKAAGRDHKSMRFVSFEGGGEALTALAGGHVSVFCGDMAEVAQAMATGAPVRILAVLSPKRLSGQHAGLPTAREQGINLSWPTVRGLYVGRNTSEAAYRRWVTLFSDALANPDIDVLRQRYGLYPFALTGKPLEDFVQEQIRAYGVMARELGLRVRG